MWLESLRNYPDPAKLRTIRPLSRSAARWICRRFSRGLVVDAVSRTTIPAEEIQTPAIVVRGRAFGESDKIVTFLTRDLGKVTGIAKGAKRSKRRFVNVLEPFTAVDVTLRVRQHSDLAFINACVLAEVYYSFTRDLEKFGYASYVMELTDRLIRGQEAGAETYDLVRDVLRFLDRCRPEPGILRAFELHLLRQTGYEPVLHECQGCGAAYRAAGRLFVQPLHGGVRCCGLRRREPSARGLGRHHRPPHRPSRRAYSTRPIPSRSPSLPRGADEARTLVRSFFASSLTKPLASERLLDEL